MAINSASVSAVGSTSNDQINNFSSISAEIKNLIGEKIQDFTNENPKGNFAGISEAGVEDLRKGLRDFKNSIQSEIDRYNSEASVAGAFKGDIGTAAQDFIDGVKELLNAYVNFIQASINDLDEAYGKYKAGTEELGKSISTDANEIRTNAGKIKLD